MSNENEIYETALNSCLFFSKIKLQSKPNITHFFLLILGWNMSWIFFLAGFMRWEMNAYWTFSVMPKAKLLSLQKFLISFLWEVLQVAFVPFAICWAPIRIPPHVKDSQSSCGIQNTLILSVTLSLSEVYMALQ